MPLIETTESDFQIPNAGMQRATLFQTIDFGTQPGSTLFPTPKRIMYFIWELPDDLMEDGKPLAINKRYTFSMHEKARLYKDLTSWLGKKPDVPFDTSSLLGLSCLLNIVHDTPADKTYANIQTVSPLMAGMAPPEPINPLVDFSLHPDYYKEATFLSLPEWQRKKIETSPEYQALGNPPVVDDGLDTNDPRFSGEADDVSDAFGG